MPPSSTSPSKQQTDLAAQEKPPRRSSFDNFFDIEIEMRRENDPQAALMANPVISKALLAVPLAAIVERSHLQTRPPFDPVGDAEDAALVESLKVRGQDTPVILEIIADRQLPEYRIKDGHRRIDALRHIGAQRVDAIVVQAGTPQSDLITLTGNVRKNFSPMEWAHALERLLQDGQSLADIARATGLVHQRLSEWKQLLDLAPEIQAALERGRITLQAALALGKAPLTLQSQLARVANQSDLTETKARQLAERVRDSLAANGPAAVEVPQIAAKLGLMPANPALATAVPTTPINALEAPAAAPQRKTVPSRAVAKTITGEAALRLLQAHFPALEPHGLADQAAACGMNEKALLLAGLMAQEDKLEAGEAVERARALPLTPEIRVQLNGLDVVAREYDQLERGTWDDKADRLLHVQWLMAKQVERVKQAAQAHKKKQPATRKKTQKGPTA